MVVHFYFDNEVYMVTASRDSVFGEISGGEAGGLDLSRRDGLLLVVHTKLRSVGNSLKDAFTFYQV